jgi:8-oxo-dGTP diphosphatase
MTVVVVTAAVIERADAFLVTRRQAGVHLEGFWEFPGGKCGPGELLDECMRRELLEELNAHATVGEELLVTTFSYDDRRLELHFIRCALLDEPQPQQGQEMRWVARADLPSLQFPPADAELIQILARTP